MSVKDNPQMIHFKVPNEWRRRVCSPRNIGNVRFLLTEMFPKMMENITKVDKRNCAMLPDQLSDLDVAGLLNNDWENKPCVRSSLTDVFNWDNKVFEDYDTDGGSWVFRWGYYVFEPFLTVKSLGSHKGSKKLRSGDKCALVVLAPVMPIFANSGIETKLWTSELNEYVLKAGRYHQPFALTIPLLIKPFTFPKKFGTFSAMFRTATLSGYDWWRGSQLVKPDKRPLWAHPFRVFGATLNTTSDENTFCGDWLELARQRKRAHYEMPCIDQSDMPVGSLFYKEGSVLDEPERRSYWVPDEEVSYV